MLPGDDELRVLQQKAYGRHGGLTDAEIGRLRELEDARREDGSRPEAARVREENARFGGGDGTDAPPGHANSSPASDAAAADAPGEHAPAEPDAEDRAPARADGDDDTAGAATAAYAALRQHWRLVAAASAVLLVIGVGAGWMLFGRGAWPTTIPASQQDALAMLEEDDYDPGSVRFAGEKHGVGIWHASKDAGMQECIVVTRGEDQSSGCREVSAERGEDASFGVSAGIDFEDDGERVMVWASFVRDISGEETTIAQRSVADEGAWEAQFTDAELADLDRLELEGFETASLQVVGYDGDLPVWQGWRAAETCLAAVLDGEAHVACRDISAGGDRIRLDVGTNAYELRETTNRGPLLTIRELSPAAGDTPDPLEVGGEHGDPIEVAPDGTEP